MPHRVLMHIVQTGEVAAFKREACLPEIVPDLSAGFFVHPIQSRGGVFVQGLHHRPEIIVGDAVFGRAGDKMVVIGEHRPGFKLPATAGSVGKEGVMQ